ncbi:DEAD/DEAH box helicase [Kribbella sp. NBC_01245]|uniref:DEAD/DEAH box helicase n=1 Tax=Kribbella sp. NBC_01245 TaxID=2903578 RepID=UPI002E2BC117|nr:DEAD/DEAH box helicase [Kribbella sp. NBC_01245]
MLPEICDALDRVGIIEPFPIQEMTLPIALMGTDLIGQARTGTGKTLGFGIPLLQRTISPGEADYEELAAPGKPQALVVTPTRELTIQVAKDLETASTVRTVRVLTIYGGVAYDPQLDKLKSGVDVVVGTPGRLLDLANRGVLDLSHIKVLVLDEADEMLDLGFLPDVERILRKTPELRQTMLFSATMPSAVIGLARTHMRHPLNIRAESHDSTEMVPTTAQFVYRAHELDKPEVVARILQAEDRGRVMIFCRTKREASRLTDDLIERGFQAAAIHGDLNQQARERALTRFRGDKIDVLVCTDVAARGIDVEGVTHVINNTCPEDEKAYVHRIGRTGRAGASGIAVTFVDWADLVRWKTINKALDLPYDEPQEMYSTSPELYHDLGIPTEAKGRIVPAKVEERPARSDRSDRSDRSARSDRSGRGDRSDRGERVEKQADQGEKKSDRPSRNRNRTRRRLRAGEPLEGTTTTTDAPAASVVTEAPAQVTSENGEVKPKRTRSRRRKTEATDAVPATDATPVTEDAKPATDEAVVTQDAPTEEQPARKPRTRSRRTAASTAPAAEAPAEVVATEPVVTEPVAAEAEPTKPKKAAAKTTKPKAKAAKAKAEPAFTEAEPSKAEAEAEAEAAPAKKAPAKRSRAKKAPAKAAQTDAAPDTSAADTEAADSAAADAPAEKPKRIRKKAATEVTFTAPE